MKPITIVFSIIVLLTSYSNNVEGQKLDEFDSDFPVLSGAYFGQTPPGSSPEIFAPGLISTQDGWEAAITFSPDGK